MAITQLSVTPNPAQPSQQITITVGVQNGWLNAYHMKADIYIDDNLVGTLDYGTLGSTETATKSLTTTAPDTAGNHTVKAVAYIYANDTWVEDDTKTTTLTVEGEDNNGGNDTGENDNTTKEVTTLGNLLEQTLTKMGFTKVLELNADQLAENTENVDIESGTGGASARATGTITLYNGQTTMEAIAIYFVLRAVADALPHDYTPQTLKMKIAIYGITDTGKELLLYRGGVGV